VSGSKAIKLTDADEHAKALMEGCLHHMAGGAGYFFAETEHPLTHLTTELGGMTVPPIDECGHRVRLETLSEPINSDPMERERGSLVGHLHRVPLLEISQDLVFRCAALGRSRHCCHRHGQGSSEG
jgi:hypothetical protein